MPEQGNSTMHEGWGEPSAVCAGRFQNSRAGIPVDQKAGNKGSEGDPSSIRFLVDRRSTPTVLELSSLLPASVALGFCMPNSGPGRTSYERVVPTHSSRPNRGTSLSFSLHQGDALSVLAGLPDGCVDSVITDPPYNSGGRTAKERTSRSAKQKYTSADATHALADFTGENMDQRSYGFWLTQIMTESHRLTKDGGTALLFTDWRQLPVTTDAIQAAGWLWRGVLAWHKPQARPQKGRFTQNCEFIVWASKGSIDGSRNPVYLPGLYSASQPSGKARQHITQKPVEVMRDLVKIAPPGGTVLDFCAGSGSTGVAALLEDRAFIGVEKTPHYAGIAADRLTETVGQTLTKDDVGLTA